MSALSDYKEASKFSLLGPCLVRLVGKNPLLVYTRLNVDRATADDRRCSSIGLVIRDFRGEVVAAFVEYSKAIFRWMRLKF